MTTKIDNEYGSILISDNIVRTIASETAMTCYGIVGLAYKNLSDGFLMLLNKDNMSKGVKVYTKNNKILIDLTVVLEYGTKIAVVCQNIIDTVKYSVENKTGLEVECVNVLVQDMRINEGK